MPHASRSTGSSVLPVDLLVQQATACGLPEVFHDHVSPRSRSIARVDLRRAIMPAIDRKCFDCKQTDRGLGLGLGSVSASVAKRYPRPPASPSGALFITQTFRMYNFIINRTVRN